MDITAYISINLLLFSSWYVLLYARKACLSFADRLIGTFVLGLTQIIATEMLLGVVFEKLSPVPLFMLNLIISMSIMIPVILTGRGNGIFTEIKDETMKVSRIMIEDKILLCIFILFFISVWWLVFLAYLFPSYSWDALYYHLPMVGQIMQSGAIQENPNPSFIQQYMNIFSKNINLFFLWNIIFLRSDVIIDISQLFFTIAGVLSIYSMAVKLGIKEKYALYSSLLFFFTPVLILQSTVNYVDGAVSMLFLVAVNFLVHDDRVHRATNHAGAKSVYRTRDPILLSGLAAGILLGSKPTGPLFIMVMLGAILVREIIRVLEPRHTMPGNKGHVFKKGLQVCLVYFIVPVFFTGGYWYMRNWIFYGNPVYYMDLSFFDITLLKGLKSDWVEPAPPIIDNLNYLKRLLHVWMERVGYYMYDSRLSGFGPIWFILFLPAILFSLVYSLIKKKYSFLFVSVILLVTFIIHPRNWTSRYVMFIVGLGALSFGLLADNFSTKAYALRYSALLLAGYTFFTANSPCIMPQKISEFILLSPHERTLSRHKPFNIDIKVQKEYGYWIWIENNISDGDTLAYTFERFELDTSRPFFTAPLWNRAFSNRVVYVKSDSYGEWLNELKNNDATYVLMKKGSTEDAWVEKERKVFYSLRWMGNMTEKFKVVYEDENYKIVRFMRGEG